MRNPKGYATITSPVPSKIYLDGFRCEEMQAGTFESDTVTCGHCGRVMHIKPRMDPADMGGLCKQCMQFECPNCVGHGCSPLERRIEEMEKRQIARRSYGV